jgi:hypothetical protein
MLGKELLESLDGGLFRVSTRELHREEKARGVAADGRRGSRTCGADSRGQPTELAATLPHLTLRLFGRLNSGNAPCFSLYSPSTRTPRTQLPPGIGGHLDLVVSGRIRCAT